LFVLSSSDLEADALKAKLLAMVGEDQETTETPKKEVAEGTAAASQVDDGPRRLIVNKSGRIFRHQRRSDGYPGDYFDIMSDWPDCAAEGCTAADLEGRPAVASSASSVHRGVLVGLVGCVRQLLAVPAPEATGVEAQVRLRREALRAVGRTARAAGERLPKSPNLDEVFMLEQSIRAENDSFPQEAVGDLLIQSQLLFHAAKVVTPVAAWAHLTFRLDLTEVPDLCGQVEEHRRRLLNYTERERGRFYPKGGAAESAPESLVLTQTFEVTQEVQVLEKIKQELEVIAMDYNLTRNAWTTAKYRADFARQVMDKEALLVKEANPRGTRDAAQELELERERRAFLMPLFLGLAGGITSYGMFRSTSLRNMVSSLEERSGFLVAQAQRHEESLAWAQAEINRTRTDVDNLLARSNELLLHVQAEVLDQYLSPAVSVCREAARRVASGLNFLLTKRLTPELVGPEVLLAALEELEGRTRGLNFDLSTLDPNAIYQAEASYVQTGPDHYHILVHLALTHADRDLQLYQMLSLPVALPGVPTIFALDIGDSLLAVDRKDSAFALMDPAMLTACFPMGHKFICPGLSTLFRDFSKSCASALYRRMEEAKEVCTVSAVPPMVQVRQISTSDWLVFHPTSNSLQIKCPGDTGVPATKKFRGTRKVTLGEGCVAASKEYEIEAPYEFSLDLGVNTLVGHYWRVLEFLADHTPAQIAPLVPAELVKPVGIPDLVAEYDRIAEKHRQRNWAASLSTALLVLAIIFGAVVLATWCQRRRIRLYMAKFALRQPYLQQLSAVLPAYLRPTAQDHLAAAGFAPHPFGPGFHPGNNPYRPLQACITGRAESACDVAPGGIKRETFVRSPQKSRSQADLASPDCAGRLKKAEELRNNEFRPTAPTATPRTRRRLEFQDLAVDSPYREAVEQLRTAKVEIHEAPKVPERPLVVLEDTIKKASYAPGARQQEFDRREAIDRRRRGDRQEAFRWEARDEIFPEADYVELRRLRPLPPREGLVVANHQRDESDPED